MINSVLFLCAVVLGGQGNKLGVILGAFIIVYLPNFFLGREELFGIPIDGNGIAQYKYLFFGIALMVLISVPTAGPNSRSAKVADLRPQTLRRRSSQGKVEDEEGAK